MPSRSAPCPAHAPTSLRRAALLLCAAAAWPAAAHAAAAPAPKPAARAADAFTLRIEAPPALAALLRDNLDLARWRKLGRLPSMQLQALVARVPEQARRLLEVDGYFSARVDAELRPRTPVPEVLVRVRPGEPSRVASVQLRVRGPAGADDEALAQRLRRRWTLPPGAVFRDAAWEDAKTRALSRLLGGSWPDARIAHSQATVDPAAHRVALALELDTGPAYRFGQLHISGLRRYPASVVRRLSPPKPGSRYDQTGLLAYQAALQNSPYFTNALVSADPRRARDGVLPIDVRVVESPARKLGFGAGVSSDTGRSVQVDWRDLNVLGRAWRLNGALKLETLQQSGSLLLSFPRTASGDDDRVGVSHSRSDIQGLATRNTSATLQRARNRGRIDTAAVLQYQIESTQPDGAPSSIVHTLSLTGSWTRRNLDSLLDPRRGSVLGLQLGAADRALLSSASFVRIDARGIVYVPLNTRNGLVVRGEVGAVLADGASGIPQNFLFRAGGAQSVRGYAYQSLGLESGGAIVGASYLLSGSVEADHWFTPRWGGAVFYDAGNAADTWSALKPVRGYVTGVRWRSPVGLISVDVAYGQALHALRLDFSAGVAF